MCPSESFNPSTAFAPQTGTLRGRRGPALGHGAEQGRGAHDITLSDGPFSAVSTPILATKYSFFSIFRDLQDLHTFAPLQSKKKLAKFKLLILQNFGENFANLLSLF